ncbi:hypothetical protein EPA93_12250 [Ktedonosporobacter rubrisoli]|uniref:Uncharacterized protein n=1 Tax=Ktedonosporobacter rubrisoli TaxID=2509675 RepID=A0A4P6JN92_KTERU|nr:hypothetical protein [Ktedonosporobacter rubrisoli]QBD76734.1 hypothetical protein EPA93_12250 [Ktedonosporobacter rubrisoli]
MAEQQDVSEQNLGMASRVGPVEVDWPRTIGYYGGIGLAWAFELLEPPLLIFIAAVPLLKMLNHPNAPKATRFVGQILEGAAKPVGGSAESTIQLADKRGPVALQPTILGEARQLARQARKKQQ